MSFRFVPIVFVLFVLTTPTVAQEETLKGAQEAFARIDRQMNEVYGEVKKKLDEWKFKKVQDGQCDWIEYRDARAEFHLQPIDGGAEQGNEKKNAEYWNALAYLTETRIEALRGWLTVDDYEEDWEGVWIDGYGGELLIEEKAEGSVKFTIHVVRGPTYHLGALAGTAKTNGSLGRFSIKPEGTEDETWLTFLQNEGRVEVLGANTMYYHGARAYFDGKYIRVGKLTDEHRKLIAEPNF